MSVKFFRIKGNESAHQRRLARNIVYWALFDELILSFSYLPRLRRIAAKIVISFELISGANKAMIKEAEGIPMGSERLLYILLPRSDREVIAGDLEEDFRTNILPKFGPRFARWWYRWQVARTIFAIVFGLVERAARIFRQIGS